MRRRVPEPAMEELYLQCATLLIFGVQCSFLEHAVREVKTASSFGSALLVQSLTRLLSGTRQIKNIL